MSDGTILIGGAGIGGLTAALALHRRGFAVSIVERAQELKPLGVGINLLPHAVRELDCLGLLGRLMPISVAPSAISFYDNDGNHLFDEPRGIEGGYQYPQLSVHRGRLQMMLLEAVRDRVGPDSVRTDAGLVGFTDVDGGVIGHTRAGDIWADILVAADGINSVVRAALHPGHDPLLWSGVQMFRGAAHHDSFLGGRTMAIIKGDGGIDMVVYPIGDGLLNWVLQVPVGEPGALAGDAGWHRPANPAEILPLVERWRLDWLDVAGLVRNTDQVFAYPMVDRNPLSHWGVGNVTLLGDAAHPMYPVGANGGSQAIVDARVLADELAYDVVNGLRRYEAKRRCDTASVVAANREMHVDGASRRPRDLARVTSQYRTDTDADRSHA